MRKIHSFPSQTKNALETVKSLVNFNKNCTAYNDKRVVHKPCTIGFGWLGQLLF